MQIPVLSGVYTSNVADVRISYPRNLVPVPKQQGISNGYLRPADGLVAWSDVTGSDRGGISWNGSLYRVLGSSVYRIDSTGASFMIGSIGPGTDGAIFDFSFDRLAIAVNRKLFYVSQSNTLTEVTDPDRGVVLDVIYIDGYFMFHDGTNLVVTDLDDPYSINPLKYGSAESSPDPIVKILKLSGEVYVVGRYTVEVHKNIGGDLYPFQRIDGATTERGAVGRDACCVFSNSICFVGSRVNEPLSVWASLNGQSQRIATSEIDLILSGYSDSVLASSCKMETRLQNGHEWLYIHLPDQTLVYDAGATKFMGESVWYTLDSGNLTKTAYKARNFVWCFGKWIFGNFGGDGLGYLDSTKSSHYGQNVGWEFSTGYLYNDSQSAIIHSLDLIALTGNVALNSTPTIFTSWSEDGQTWSLERPTGAGRYGWRDAPIRWLRQGIIRRARVQKFRGSSEAYMSFLRLEARLEGLYA